MKRESLNSGAVEIVMLVEGDIVTTQLIERLLLACKPYRLNYRKVYLYLMRVAQLDGHTLPLLVRCADPLARIWTRLLCRARYPYVYYIDDNFWELQGDSELVRYYRDPVIRESLEFAVSNAHTVLTNSETLAEYLTRFTLRVCVLPAFFDFALIEGSRREETAELRIGFAGSPSRGDDLILIAPIVSKVLEFIPNAVFEFCGVMPEGMQPGPRIRFFEHTNSYAEFIRFQAERNWAVGLAPLRDIAANRAKTNNKYREYGACGIAGVYSDIPPYRGCVEQRKTGLLVGSSTEEWLAAVLELLGDSGLRERIGRDAEEQIRQTYSVEVVARLWTERLRAASAALPRRTARIRVAYLRGIFLEVFRLNIRILGLQIQDAYRKGGSRFVIVKAAQRLGWRKGSGRDEA